MENQIENVENEMETLGSFRDNGEQYLLELGTGVEGLKGRVGRLYGTIMESQMEQTMGNNMKAALA